MDKKYIIAISSIAIILLFFLTDTFSYVLTFLILISPVFLMALYMIPSILAVKRKNKDLIIIMIVNLLLGFTIIGWLFCLYLVLRKEDTQNG
jgi:hypothetical protein